MRFRKDDPLYYTNKIKELLKQAKENNVKVTVPTGNNEIRIYFIGENGDTIGVTIEESL